MKTSEQMIQELYTVTLGVPDTENKGMAGDLKEIKEHLKELNGKVTSNTTWRKAMVWAIGVIGTGLGIVAGIVLG